MRKLSSREIFELLQRSAPFEFGTRSTPAESDWIQIGEPANEIVTKLRIRRTAAAQRGSARRNARARGTDEHSLVVQPQKYPIGGGHE